MQTFINQTPQLHYNPPKEFSSTMLSLLGETPLLSCSEAGVNSIGGPIAKAAIIHINQMFKADVQFAKEQGLSAIVDLRVHRLFPEQYPAIPGWHCDAVPRDTYHGQPNFDAINPAAFHVCFTLSTDKVGVSNTEYVADAIRPKIYDPEHVYRDLHNEVERIGPRIRRVEDGVFVKFTPKTIHRATPAHRRGIRLFMRYSMYHKPPIMNAIQAAAQVYQLSERNGW